MIKQLPLSILCLVLLMTGPLPGQSWEIRDRNGDISAGAGFEYFQRTVSLGENSDNTASMHGLIFSLGADYRLGNHFSLGGFAGYALSGFDRIIFRELPFSLQLNEENITGILAGARFSAGSLFLSQFEIKGAGQFVYFIGMDQTWDIPGLAVSGQATGKTDWMRVTAGPVIYYAEPLIFSPYMAVQLNYLWGSFTMEEDIENLSGSQDLNIKAKGFVSVSAGGTTRLTPELELAADISVIPSEGGVDFGIMLNIAYIF
jgi:hypothetical protein